MKIADVVSFINPFGDALSAIFVLLLVSLSVLTVVWVYLSANIENWESIWHGEHLDDGVNLDNEYGSVQELSEAVATKAEQIAEIMPSMLLIVGLLGTFIGLGIALNSASEVLASANTSGMDVAMANLMGLMEGLGAKFKTSTWGLLCFIVLNIVFNILGFKEKRLSWAITKVRKEIESKNAKKAKLEQDKYEKLLKSILFLNKQNQDRSEQLVEFFSSAQQKFLTQYDNTSQSFQTLFYDNFNTQLSELKNISKSNEAIQKTSIATTDELKVVVNSLIKGFEANARQLQNNSDKSLLELKKINENNEFLQHTLQNFSEKATDGIASLNAQNSDMIGLMSDGIKEQSEKLEAIVVSNQGIQQTSKNTTTELKNMINALTMGFEQNTKQLQKGSDRSLEQLQNIAKYNQQTQQAMQDFVDKTVSSMASIGDSADKMGESAKAVGNSASDLNAVVHTLKSELGDVMSMIKKDLGETIVGMSDSFKENIVQMSDSIQSNMAEMSSSMSNATKGIENAVGDLSVNVGNTMNEVTQTIGKSMDLQEKSAREFTVTSESLNIQIMEMTNLVQQLSNDIVSSLKSVAENGRRMDNIGKKLEGFSEFIGNLSTTNPQLVEQLKKISTHNEVFAKSLSKLSEKNDVEYWQNLMDVNKSIKNELKNLVALFGQSIHTKHYEKMLESIYSSIDNLSKQLVAYHQNEQKELTYAEKAK